MNIVNKAGKFCLDMRKPYIIKWKCKCKERQGVRQAIGWVMPGEEKGTIRLVHQTFRTWDDVEQEYCSTWVIYYSQILSIRKLGKI